MTSLCEKFNFVRPTYPEFGFLNQKSEILHLFVDKEAIMVLESYNISYYEPISSVNFCHLLFLLFSIVNSRRVHDT